MAVNTITYANKVNLNENSGIAEINKITDANMNEIKSVVNNNATELSNLQGSILWTNPNPSASVNSGATATLSSSNYDYLIWIYCFNNTNLANTSIHKSSICLKGNSVIMNIIGAASGSSARRVATRVSDTQYTFGDGYDSNNNVSGTVCIPLYAIGCKL